MKLNDRFVMIEIDEVRNPEHGDEVIKDSWWPSKDGYVLGYYPSGSRLKGRPTPQCNKDIRVATMVTEILLPGFELIFIPVAYWPTG